MLREEWALQRTGEENDPAVADADRAEHREAVFGQTCPIETAVDVPVDGFEGRRQWHHSGGGCSGYPAQPPAHPRQNTCCIITPFDDSKEPEYVAIDNGKGMPAISGNFRRRPRNDSLQSRTATSCPTDATSEPLRSRAEQLAVLDLAWILVVAIPPWGFTRRTGRLLQLERLPVLLA